MTLDLPEAAISIPEPELAATVAAQAAVIVELRAVIAEQVRLIETLTARVAELERQLGKHSRNSSKPPSSDGLGKPPVATRQRGGGGRRPGKQPGAPGAHLAQVPEPDQVVVHRPERCDGCGGDLTLAPVTEFGFSWTEPTELFGKTNLVAACPSGVAPSTATARAVTAMTVFTFSLVFIGASFLRVGVVLSTPHVAAQRFSVGRG